MSPFDFKLAFQNVDRIRVWLLKKSCRTLNLEQLLFLEIFKLLHKFGSNLKILANDNFVNMGNSSHRSHLIAGDLLLGSRRARGRLWRHAGAEKAPAWLPCASKLRY